MNAVPSNAKFGGDQLNKYIGDIGNGWYWGGEGNPIFETPAYSIPPGEYVTVSYGAVNAHNLSQHDRLDWAQAASEVLGGLGAGIPGAGAMFAVWEGAKKIMPGLVVGGCDGPVIAESHMWTRSDLDSYTAGNGTAHLPYVENPGVASKLGCGPNSMYYTYTYIERVPLPTEVSGLVVTGKSSNQVNLAWTRNIDSQFDHYNIYRDLISGGSVTPLTHTIGTTTINSYISTGLEPCTTYYYKVADVEKTKYGPFAGAEKIGPYSEISVTTDKKTIPQGAGFGSPCALTVSRGSGTTTATTTPPVPPANQSPGKPPSSELSTAHGKTTL